MQTITEDLLKELKNSPDIDSFFKAHQNDFIDKTLSEYLNDILTIKGKSIASVASSSGAGEYVYKIFKGERNPSRDILISVAFGLKLSFEETQFLMRIAKFAKLDSRDKRDSVIIYGITHELSVFETDDMLHDKNLITIN